MEQLVHYLVQAAEAVLPHLALTEPLQQAERVALALHLPLLVLPLLTLAVAAVQLWHQERSELAAQAVVAQAQLVVMEPLEAQTPAVVVEALIVASQQ